MAVSQGERVIEGAKRGPRRASTTMQACPARVF